MIVGSYEQTAEGRYFDFLACHGGFRVFDAADLQGGSVSKGFSKEPQGAN